MWCQSTSRRRNTSGKKKRAKGRGLLDLLQSAARIMIDQYCKSLRQIPIERDLLLNSFAAEKPMAPQDDGFIGRRDSNTKR